MHKTHTTTAWGIDVGKISLELCALSGVNGARSYYTVKNNPEGWKQLVDMAKKEPKDTVTVLLEATGDYHLGCAMALTQAGITVKVTNPYVVHTYAKMNMRKTKTDKQDSEKIAELIYAKYDLHPFTISPHREMKKMVRIRRTYVEVRQKLTNTLRSLEDGQRMGAGDLSEAIRIIEETLKHIQETLTHIDQTMRISEPVEHAITTVGKIKGVSEESIAQIVVELGDINRFTSREQVVAYCGLDPSVHTSGTSVHGKSKLSKRGSPTLRGVLTKVAWGLMMHDADAKKYYQRKRAEGKHYFTCLVAIARQFLIRLWTVLKKKVQYLTPTQLEEQRQMKQQMGAVALRAT